MSVTRQSQPMSIDYGFVPITSCGSTMVSIVSQSFVLTSRHNVEPKNSQFCPLGPKEFPPTPFRNC